MKEKKVINRNVYENILLAVTIMLYFILINFAYYNIGEISLILGLKIASTVLLILGIIFIEIAYNKENGKIAFHAIELLVLSGFTLSIKHIVEIRNLDFPDFIVLSSYVFSIYYIFKAVILYTKERREYLKSLSDIREIVDIKPIKKEAKKTNK